MSKLFFTILITTISTPVFADVCVRWDQFVPPHKMEEAKEYNNLAVVYRQDNWEKLNLEWAEATDYNDPIGSLNRRARLGDNVARKYLADDRIANDYDWCAWAKINKDIKLFW